MTTKVALGIDVGGTKVQMALVDASGNVLSALRADSRYGMDPGEWIALAVAGADQLQRQSPGVELTGIGVGFAGQIDRSSGTVLGSPNVGWRDFPLRAMLAQAFGLPALVTNDVQAATWGEWRKGAGQGTRNLLCVFVGTGIGGGLVLDGAPYAGATGSAGEFGHTVLDRNGPPCKCGGKGCLEAFAGGWAIAARAHAAIRAYPEHGKPLLALAQGRLDDVTAATVAHAAHAGDGLALDLVRQVGEDLGMGVASAVNAFNPEKVILGGGVVEGLPELVETVRGVVARQALPSATRSLRIEKAMLGGYAGTVGAALLALEPH